MYIVRKSRERESVRSENKKNSSERIRRITEMQMETNEFSS